MRTLIVWALLCACSLAAEVPTTAPVYSLVRVKLETGERATVLSAALVPVDSIRTYEGIAFTGPPGRYAVLVIGTEDVETKFCEIVGAKPPVPPPPNPGPDPEPEPDEPDAPLDATGARLYPIIKRIPDKPSMVKIAGNYRAVLNDLNAGTITNVHEARTKLASLNSGMTLVQAWKPAIEAMTAELNGAVGDIEKVKKVMRGTIAALELAAK